MKLRGSERSRSWVSNAFQQSRDIHGYLVPSYIAFQLAPENDALQKQIQTEIYEYPTRPFFFWGARFTIRHLLKKGDAVAIWTDEYRERIESSKLQVLQKHGDLDFLLDEQKENSITKMFQHARDRNISEIIIVDDQIAGLRKVQEYAQQCPDISVRLLLVNRNNGDGNKELTDEITRIDNVRKVRGIRRKQTSGKKLWIFDFNDTLIDRTSYEKRVEKRVGLLARRNVGFAA